MKRSAFPAVLCYPLESFFTNRLYHLLGNLSRYHLASSTPVFSHVAMCTTRVDRHLSSFLCVFDGMWGENAFFLVFFFLIISISLICVLCIKHKEGSETNHSSRSFKKASFFFLNFIFGGEGREGNRMINGILNLFSFT